MPAGYGATEMIGPLTPALICWASLILTVLGLLLGFFYTNITAFARRLRNGQRKDTYGSTTTNKNAY